MKTNKKIIVVGGGVGGLAAAALLAQQSYQVTLYEKNVLLGGRASYRKTNGGYTLDFGIHALRGAEKGPAAQILKMIGKPIDFAVKNSDGVMPMIYHNGRIVDTPYTTINLIRYPLLNFIQKIRLMQIIRRASKSDPVQFDNTTVSDWLEGMNGKKILQDECLVDHLKLFLSIAFYCEADFNKMSAGDFIRFFQKYPYDVGYPKGGWSQIIDKLRISIEENGGKIVTGRGVDQVIIISEDKEKKKRATGVIVEGKKEEDADLVILNTPAKSILQLVPKEHIPTSFAETLAAYENTSGIVIDVVGIPTKLLHTSKYDTVVNLNPSAIIRIPSRYDREIAPLEKDILTAWMPIRSDILHDQDQTESKFAQLLHLIEQIFPGVLANSEFQRRMICQMVIGRSPTAAVSPSKRLPIQFPKINGLYFVGDAADADGIGGSSDAAFLSALECAEQIKKTIIPAQER
jgi:phytoene dehydrogenase-like protein